MRQENDPPQGIPFQLQTDWPGLNQAWNAADTCADSHAGPYIVLEDTNQRRCLRCFYAEAFLSGISAGAQSDFDYMRAIQDQEAQEP
jgi:hypothetical protein